MPSEHKEIIWNVPKHRVHSNIINIMNDTKPVSFRLCPYCGRCKRSVHLHALVPPTPAVQLERKDWRQTTPTHHYLTTTVTRTQKLQWITWREERTETYEDSSCVRCGVSNPACRRAQACRFVIHSLHKHTHCPPLLRDETPRTINAMLMPTSQAILRPNITQPWIHFQTGRQFVNHNIKGSCFTTHTGDLEKRRDRCSQLRDWERHQPKLA